MVLTVLCSTDGIAGVMGVDGDSSGKSAEAGAGGGEGGSRLSPVSQESAFDGPFLFFLSVAVCLTRHGLL